MTIVTATSPDEVQQIIDKNASVIIDLFTDWCPPCKDIAQLLKKIDEIYGDSIAIVKINTETSEETGIDTLPFFKDVLELGYVPILVFFKKGERVDKRMDRSEKKKGFLSGYAPGHESVIKKFIATK